LTSEASLPSKSERKRKTSRKLLEVRAKIKELSKSGKTPIEISKILDISKTATYKHFTSMIQDGQLNDNETTYVKAGPLEERKWYKVIERTREELPFYQKQGLIPTARKMYYRLIELGVLTKSESNYNMFCKKSAEARRRVDSTYTKPTKIPRLPIDCFRDDNRDTIGDTAMSEPIDPTPSEPPDDPIEVTNNAIQECKDRILGYDGACYEGENGVNPGRWHKQPIYCEVWCESETIQPDLLKFQQGRAVKVASTRGFLSTPFMYQSCKRLKQMAEEYNWIEKIVILYFGDSDDTGNKIRKNILAGLEWYQGQSDEFHIPVLVELHLVAITPEQVKKFKLRGYQLEAFMTTEKRLRDFKKILWNAIDNCWNEGIYYDNCPDEKYDYEANGEQEPEGIDPDNELYENTDLTIREKMVKKATDAFQQGWHRRYYEGTSD
jgi:hypothetical protein